MNAPGAFEVILRAYDLVENASSLEEVERALIEVRAFDPDHEILAELEWKRVDLLVQERLARGVSGGEVSVGGHLPSRELHRLGGS